MRTPMQNLFFNGNDLQKEGFEHKPYFTNLASTQDLTIHVFYGRRRYPCSSCGSSFWHFMKYSTINSFEEDDRRSKGLRNGSIKIHLKYSAFHFAEEMIRHLKQRMGASTSFIASHLSFGKVWWKRAIKCLLVSYIHRQLLIHLQSQKALEACWSMILKTVSSNHMPLYSINNM